MITINNTLLNEQTSKAQVSSRLRTNYNFHQDYADPMNRMLNCLEPGTYTRPHKHENPDKREIFLILRGKLAVLEYDETGNILECVVLNPLAGNYGVEIPAGTWHSVISLEAGTVVYEFKDGPYMPINDKNFAAWSPAEEEPECADFLKELTRKAGLI
jgi:cupin fold WbuC family metalloprotein